MSEQSIQVVDYERRDGIAYLKLNRPRKLNAFTDDMSIQLLAAMERFDGDQDALAAILHGEGRAFCSGADVQQRQLRSREEFEELGGAEGRGVRTLDIFTRSVHWKPVVALVHGYALGVGLALALSADLVVAEEGCRMQVTETARGLASSRIWAMLAARGTGGFALDAALTGRYFSAEEAFGAGVVDRLAPAGEGLAVALELSQAMAANPPLAVRAIVRSRRRRLDLLEREMAFETAPLNLHLTEDFKQSALAFAQKRKPEPFVGR
ncbi:enoyl-CoA hydratase/isomerase family protein [Bradyrhizobium sp. ma5]|uniref:enoyl-CoA hydratase/isomerase family protein n=1 Tax=Bradyrhizobium sp. ma5 TaxID=3344828 RepID=UPI0035D42F4F